MNSSSPVQAPLSACGYGSRSRGPDDPASNPQVVILISFVIAVWILILNVGKGSNTAFDAAGAMRIDYVRAWKPAA